MVAYNFKAGFVAPIRALEKRQTIRNPRKRHAREGEALQLFTGDRFHPVRLGAATCIAISEVRLDFENFTVHLDEALFAYTPDDLEAFAVRDGFRPPAHFEDIEPWDYMSRWWRFTHPDKPVFRGDLADWGDTFKAVEA